MNRDKIKERQSLEANYFARCLLMPKPLVVEEFNKIKTKSNYQNIIVLLSEKFQVENEAMRSCVLKT